MNCLAMSEVSEEGLVCGNIKRFILVEVDLMNLEQMAGGAVLSYIFEYKTCIGKKYKYRGCGGREEQNTQV